MRLAAILQKTSKKLKISSRLLHSLYLLSSIFLSKIPHSKFIYLFICKFLSSCKIIMPTSFESILLIFWTTWCPHITSQNYVHQFFWNVHTYISLSSSLCSTTEDPQYVSIAFCAQVPWISTVSIHLSLLNHDYLSKIYLYPSLCSSNANLSFHHSSMHCLSIYLYISLCSSTYCIHRSISISTTLYLHRLMTRSACPPGLAGSRL